MEKDRKSEKAELRQKAEEFVKHEPSKTSEYISKAEALLIHELQIHQIELEMQNEELMRAKAIAEAALDKYTYLYDFAPTGYFTLSKAGEIIELNLSCANIIGKDRSNLKNRKFGLFVSEETKPIFNHFLEEIFHTETKECCEIKLIQNDDVQIYVEIVGVVSENRENCYLNIVDITERMKAEEEIKLKNEELQKANAEKDKFFSIIAHDLRGPLGNYMGLAQIMADELPTLKINEIYKISKALSDSATNIYHLLENLLNWSLIHQGLLTFNPLVIQLLPLVNESIEVVLETAKIKGIEISVDISNNLQVFADKNMLQTVIRNLVTNSVKFTHKGGKINISAQNNDDKSVEISINDTGIGMDKDILDNLYRIDVKTARKGTEGELSTGLGLLLCKEFIEKHNGKLWVVSKEGKGSTFYFTLPIGD
ncbi:MAG: PAS domain-containing sensor histidine kinase [bacterium]